MYLIRFFSVFALLGIALSNVDKWDGRSEISALQKRQGVGGVTTTEGNLTANIPLGCQFPVGSAINYIYWDLTDETPDKKSCCVGAVVGGLTFPPGCQAYNQNNREDAIASVEGQLAKDGALVTTTVGFWRASFYWPPTSAFDDRTLDYFSDQFLLVNNCTDCVLYDGFGSTHWLYSRHLNYMITEWEGTLTCDDNGPDYPNPNGPSWRDPYGQVAAGNFSWFITPRWSSVASVAYFWVFTQDGDTNGDIIHGPFQTNCTSESDWQGIPGSSTSLPYDITYQAGHLCATGAANNNYDGLHIKYADLYVDIPDNINSGYCIKHDGGVSCQYAVNPP